MFVAAAIDVDGAKNMAQATMPSVALHGLGGGVGPRLNLGETKAESLRLVPVQITDFRPIENPVAKRIFFR